MSALSNAWRLFVVVLVCFGAAPVSQAANRTFIGPSPWDGVNSKWTNNDEPDADDVAVFDSNSPSSVDLAIPSQTIMGLTMSDGIALSLNGNDLTVDGDVVLSDASTDLFVPTNSTLLADRIIINSGGDITLQGGVITVVEETGSGYLDVNNGGELSGNGTINFNDGVSPGALNLFNLDGELNAHSTAPFDIGSLAAATLTITVFDADGIIDLDGNDGVSTINVLRNDTLNLNGGVLDSGYSGTINLSSGATFSRNVAWSLNGTLNANTTVGGAAATIAGAQFTQTGGTIAVDAGETLRFTSVFHADDGVIANNGLIIFDNAATIDNASQLQTGTQGSIEVNNGEVQIFDQGWDWDGDGGLNNSITINDLGDLSVFSLADNTWDGAMYLNGGNLFVFDVWAQSGGLINIGGTTSSSFNVVGPGVQFSKTGGAFNVEPAAALGIASPNVWSGGSLNVDGSLTLGNSVTWNGGIAITGNGEIVIEATSVVAANTTINVHTFDWDGAEDWLSNVHSINSGVSFTLNIVDFDADVNDDDMDDAINLGGNGAQLIVNGPFQWIMRDTFTANTAGAGTATIGGTSRMVLAGALNVNGNTVISAPVTFGGNSITSLDLGTTLTVTSSDARYFNATITTAAIASFVPGSTNRVQTFGGPSLSTISTTVFDFDAGTWTIDPSATLVVDVFSYDTSDTTFDSTVTLNSGTVDINSGQAVFVVNSGTINLNNNTGVRPTWTGQPLTLGDDVGTLNAHLNVSGTAGTGISRINSIVRFNSDAEVNIAPGATLVLGATATFAPVNAANNGQFTGGGTLTTNGNVDFDEATTLNFVGGTVDFDGEDTDNTGNLIHVDAPVTINAASLEAFGRAKSSLTDSLEINHESHIGSLTVNLDDPNGEWTLDAPGQMVLITNFVPATLLAGSDVNLNGSVFVGGFVQIAARVDIGSTGEINIFDADGSLTLSGGSVNDPNTIDGGAINGPGELIIGPGTALAGNGTISALTNQGALMPGTSPGQIQIDTYTQTANAVLEIELGGIGPEDFDRLIVTGQAALDGTLDLSLIDDFFPTGDETFDILDWGALIGTFATVQLPPLQGGLIWNTNELYTAGRLSIDGLLGDFNHDDTVDAADYVWWRKFDGTNAGYDLWQEHFGETAGFAAGAAIKPPEAAVPEPGIIISFPLAVAGLLFARRGKSMSMR